MTAQIKDIKSREILDSRGNPTIETLVILDNGIASYASVPSGASTGIHEASELRDNDGNRYHGKGVLKAVSNVHTLIKPLLLGKNPYDQISIDKIMLDADGTPNKSRLGANSILSVSMAVARVSAKSQNIPLYLYINKLTGLPVPYKTTPIFNVINGGLHGNGKIPFQEFIFVPNSEMTYGASLQMGTELYMDLKKYLHNKGFSTGIGDEGGFTPQVQSNEEVLLLLKQVIDESKYAYGKDVFLSLDIAASTFYKDGQYFPVNAETPYKPLSYIEYLINLKNKFHLYSIEDPLAEDDWESWKIFNSKIGSETLIIGDDLLVTNQERLKKAIENNSCNAILVKVNQIGTVSETLDVIKMAKSAKFKVIVSHRSGETNDDFIADLAIGTGADFIKAGAPARGERLAKYNRLSLICEN
jgi:enolase